MSPHAFAIPSGTVSGITPTLPPSGGGNRPKSYPGKRRPCPREQAPDRTCFLYLFVHSQEPRFKIGVSVTPLNRLAQLDEAQSVDVSQSMVVRLPSVKRAKEVEGLLHKAMSHLRIAPNAKARHDGDTEWFELSALPLAMQLIVHTPAPTKSASLLVEPLSAYAGLVDYGPRDISGINHQMSLLTHNLEVVQVASQLLLRVAQDLVVSVHGVGRSTTDHPTIVLHQFRRYGQQECQTQSGIGSGTSSRQARAPHSGQETERFLLRMKVMDLESYRLLRLPSLNSDQGGAAPASLVQVISYGHGNGHSADVSAGADDLVIRFASPHQLCAFPGGEQLSIAVQALVSQLGLMSLTAQRAHMHAMALRSRPQVFPDLEPGTRLIRRPPAKARVHTAFVH